MRLEDYLRLLRRRWVVVVVVAALGFIAATAFTLVQRPKYESTSESFLAAGGSSSVSDLSQGATYTRDAVQGYARIASTEYILAPVIRELGLEVEPTVLAKEVTAAADPDTAVLAVTVRDSSPVRAARIADAITDRLAVSVGELTPGQAGDTPLRITRVQSASVATAPVSPNIALNLVVGLLTGLVFGAGLALARESLDTRLRTAQDLEQSSEAPVLGSVLLDPQVDSRPLVVAAEEQSIEAEAFRTLRTSLRFLSLDGSSRAFVITSSVPGEGKSTTAANLATALALVEDSVIVVDTDLRRPRLHEIFSLDGTVGLVDVLIGEADLDDVLQAWGPHGLLVLPAGRTPPNPSELLQSEAMATVMAALRERAATVLLDAPPLIPVADAAILAKASDGAIVVAEMRRVHRAQLRQSLHLLRRADARVLGTVATMVPRNRIDAYDYRGADLGRDGRSRRVTRWARWAR